MDKKAKFNLAKVKKLAKKDQFIAFALKTDCPKKVFNSYIINDSVLLKVYNG